MEHWCKHVVKQCMHLHDIESCLFNRLHPSPVDILYGGAEKLRRLLTCQEKVLALLQDKAQDVLVVQGTAHDGNMFMVSG